MGAHLREVGDLVGLSICNNPELSYLFPGLPFQGCHPRTCNDRVVRDDEASRFSHPWNQT